MGGATMTINGDWFYHTGKPRDENAMHPDAPGYVYSMQVRKVVTIWAVVGTLCWAFGDWMVDFLHGGSI